MQIQQPAELNNYVDATIPLTWEVRWRALKPALPLLIICSVLLVEQSAFRLWLDDRDLGSELPLLLVCALTPIALALSAFEAQVRFRHRAKRWIKLDPKRVSISPAKCNYVAWNQISGWRLEPLGTWVPGLSKMTLEYSLDRKGKMRREWSMVLRQSDQEYALSAELEHLRQVGLNTAEVRRLTEPRPTEPIRRCAGPMFALALGFWCLAHGLPLFGVGLLPPEPHRDEPSLNSRFTAAEKAKLQRTVARHFTSLRDFRRFLLVTGGGMTAMGVGLYIWGLTSSKSSAGATPDSEKNAAEDEERFGPHGLKNSALPRAGSFPNRGR